MLNALEVCAIVVVGVMVGVEFAVAFVLNPILDALPGDGGQLGRSHGGRMLGAVMPVWYLTSLALVAALAVAGGNGHGAGLTVAAGGLLVVSVIMSVLLLVPLNDRGKKWTPEHRPADWKEQAQRWDRLHHVRVGVIVAAFAALAAGLT